MDSIDFEWMLMSKLLGKPLAEVWRSMSATAKERLVGQLAAFSSHLFEHQQKGIGNLYLDSPIASGSGTELGEFEECSSTPKDLIFQVGRIVSMQFFWGDHIHMDVHRGPFHRSKDWLAARMVLDERDSASTLAKYEHIDEGDMGSDIESDIDDAKTILRIISKLRGFLDQVFLDDHWHDEMESSMLFHDDLSGYNILVDDDGALTGLIDWECVSVLPLWNGCYYPAFMLDRPRLSAPNLDRYKQEVNGEPSDLYWEHLKEYELTKLRSFFLTEMTRIQPAWMDVFNMCQLQRDFETAIHNYSNEFLTGTILGWIEDLETIENDVRSLRDRIDD